MFERIKKFIKAHLFGFIAGVVCVIILASFFSCSSIGDNNRVQFGLTNESVSEGSIAIKDV